MSRINVFFHCDDGTDSEIFVDQFSNALRHRLERRDFKLNCIRTDSPFELQHGVPAPDLICTRLSQIDPVETLGPLVHKLGATPILLVTAPDELSKAFQAVQLGAWDFVTLPVEEERITTVAGAFIRLHGARLRRSREVASESAASPSASAETFVAAAALSRPELTQAAIHVRESDQSKPSCRPYWQQEQDIIENALRIFDGNISRAAAALEISPSTIYRKRQAWNERGLAT